MDISKSINTSFAKKTKKQTNNTIFQVHTNMQTARMVMKRPLGLQVKQLTLRLNNY